MNNFNLRFSIESNGLSTYHSYLISCNQDVSTQTIAGEVVKKLRMIAKELDVELNLEEQVEGKEVESPFPFADVSRENPS